MSSSSARRARLPASIFTALVPLLSLLVLLGWGAASPVGSSPDEDFHLASIWCAAGERTSLCIETGDPATREVPVPFSDDPCFARFVERSGSCQTAALDDQELVVSDRGNFRGSYPPVFYGTLSLFATDAVEESVLVMRGFNSLLFVGLLTAVALLAPRELRRGIVTTALVTMVPLGLFLVPSVNPSSWGITGVAVTWFASYGWMLSTDGRRRWGLAALAVIGVVMASGARADGAVYASLALAAAVWITITRERRSLLSALLPIGLVVVAALFALSSRQLASAAGGFGNAPAVEAPADAVPGAEAVAATALPDWFSLAVSNILQAPSLWAGALGAWPLGWFDTPVPAVVSVGCGAVLVAAIAIGAGSSTARKATLLVAAIAALWFIPVWTLTRGGDAVGSQVQPRYLLPLIVLLAAFALLPGRMVAVRFSGLQVVLGLGVLALAMPAALFATVRRFVTGLDEGGGNLSAGAEWWWGGPTGPMATFLLVSAAWWMLLLVIGLLARGEGPARLDAVGEDQEPLLPVAAGSEERPSGTGAVRVEGAG